MKILIDIGHPAHVHYFRNFIEVMKGRGHEFCITARNKEITFELLRHYGISFVDRGTGARGLAGKVLYILKADGILLAAARKFKPDIFLSFASTYAAHVAWLMRKPHIAMDDTEHARFEIFLYKPFTEVVLTPFCFLKDFGKKQVRFHSFVELTYLHKKYLKLLPDIRKELGLQPGEKYVLLRFISWTASHDFGQKGISNVLKKELVSLFLKSNYKVFVSAESTEDKFFEPYLLRIHPAKIHSVIAGASMLVGESGTMSTEACVLGTPAVFVNSLDAGVFKEEAKRELLYSYRNAENLLGKISLLLADRELETKHRARAAQLQAEFINVTDLLVWFVSDFPQSKKLMTAQPEIQNRFLDDTSAIRI